MPTGAVGRNLHIEFIVVRGAVGQFAALSCCLIEECGIRFRFVWNLYAMNPAAAPSLQVYIVLGSLCFRLQGAFFAGGLLGGAPMIVGGHAMLPVLVPAVFLTVPVLLNAVRP